MYTYLFIYIYIYTLIYVKKKHEQLRILALIGLRPYSFWSGLQFSLPHFPPFHFVKLLELLQILLIIIMNEKSAKYLLNMRLY